MKNDRQTSVRVPQRIRANNGDVLLQAAIDGLGIVQTPDFLATEAIADGLLVPILTDYTVPAGGIYAIYPQQRYLPQRIRTLIDYLSDHLKADAQ